MKNRFKVLFIVPAMLIILSSSYIYAKDVVLKKPPASLDQFYPPISKEPKFTRQMLNMSSHFGGVFLDMREADWENAENHANKLLEVYKKTSKMVPEWKDYFDLEAAKNFANAVKTHNPEQIDKASKALGKTCHKCHVENQIAVWTRYHWPSTKSIKIVDPVSEEELEFGKYMGKLSGAFKGVTVNFGEGQYDRAAKALIGFQKKYMELKSTCSKCHTNDNVKQFYVGDNIKAALQNMKTELASAKPNIENFWKNVGVIGKEGCKMCHLIHRPFAKIQKIWEEK